MTAHPLSEGELEYLRAEYAKPTLPAIQGERDGERLLATLDAARARVAELEKALSAVQWNGEFFRDRAGIVMRACPDCDAFENEGHKQTCGLSAALAARGDVKEQT
jgi:hypothetical protein